MAASKKTPGAKSAARKPAPAGRAVLHPTPAEAKARAETAAKLASDKAAAEAAARLAAEQAAQRAQAEAAAEAAADAEKRRLIAEREEADARAAAAATLAAEQAAERAAAEAAAKVEAEALAVAEAIAKAEAEALAAAEREREKLLALVGIRPGRAAAALETCAAVGAGLHDASLEWVALAHSRAQSRVDVVAALLTCASPLEFMSLQAKIAQEDAELLRQTGMRVREIAAETVRQAF
jgi:hypothetical protein